MALFTWPNGAQCAAALTFDADGETIPLVQDKERGHERLTLISTSTYGPQVGVPRILDVLQAFGLKASFFVPGFTAELHPEMIERMLAEGHEVGHHGYLHERPDTLSDEEEEAVLVRGIEVLERLTGKKPVGYRSPAWELKPSSPALLKRYGFQYDSSLMGNDIPYYVATAEGNLLELPIQWMNDDWPFFGSRPILPASLPYEIWTEELKALYAEPGKLYVLTAEQSGKVQRLKLAELQ
jgi:peptidoglycan/xylan/chitin deacetylase (PgdA/CDA1 family)